MDFTNFLADSVDIHHIFPQKYCESKGYDRRKWNSVVNKTPLAYRTNRMIGGVAPGKRITNLNSTEVVDAFGRSLE
ncbi:MAG: hypothetical protein LBF83_10815 [Spirochaetaceae bacterium]|nr:hypothetical protein [Spirochaetaceae bacterium]